MTGAGFAAEGCGAMPAAGSAAVTLVRGRAAAQRRARRDARDAVRARRSLPGQAARGGGSGRRRAAPRARSGGGRARRRSSPTPPQARRHERRRRFRGRRAARRRDAVGGDAGVGRPGERRGGLVLLGRRRPARAFGRAPDGHAALHARPAPGVPGRASWSRSWRDTRRGDAEPLRALQRARASRSDARATPTARRRHPGQRPLRAGRRHGRPASRAADPAKDQGYVLAASPRARWPACASLSPKWRSPRCARSRPRSSFPYSTSRDSQEICFVPPNQD